MEAYLKAAQTLSHTGSFGWRPATGEIVWSEETYQITGYDRGTKPTLELVFQRIHPEDTVFVQEALDRGTLNGTDLDFEHRLLLPDGSVKCVHIVAHAVRDESFLELTHEDYRASNWEFSTELLEGKRKQFQIEKQYWRKDGSSIWVSNNVSLVPGTKSMPRFIMALSEDITERKRAQDALHHAQMELAHATRIATIGQLSASIAHELNQPLTGIITNCSTCLRMLTGDPPNLDGARETVRRTMRDANRASEVITRLRALFSKREATAESVDLNESTREVIALSLGELQKGQVIVRTEFADDLPLVTGDRVQLQQVVLNLLLNALDAMNGVNDRPRELVIRTERWKGECVCVSVRDSGVGFEPHAVDKLFEAFYTTKHDGMGMGLSVSRSIIESHHGRLWATPNDGPGATLSFSIPCRTDTKV
jgi:C4-dicarboxylate-specific signal transduction histidine kinase